MGKINLRNLLSFAHKRFIQTKATPSSAPKPPPLDIALLDSKNPQILEEKSLNFLSIVKCLKCHGFDDAGIVKLVTKHPSIVHFKVNNNLEPKLEYLGRKGYTGQLLSQFILSNPFILFRSLDNQIKPAFEFMQSFLNDKEVLIALKRSSWLLTINLNLIMQPNVDLLISEGVSVSRISKLIKLQPRVIMQSHDRIVNAVKMVKKVGLAPSEPRFIHAVRVVCSFSESNWKKRVEFFMSHGWSKEDVFNTLKKDPICLACSEKKVRFLMDFYVNTMKTDPRTVIRYPKLLLYSIDKRVLRRYSVLKVLASKNLMDVDRKTVWLITMTEKKFLEEYVIKFKSEIPGLLDMYLPAVKQTKPSRGKKGKSDTNKASLSS